jgi:hypothetical protein
MWLHTVKVNLQWISNRNVDFKAKVKIGHCSKFFTL